MTEVIVLLQEGINGARAITKWDAGLQRYRTDVTKAPQGDQAPQR